MFSFDPYSPAIDADPFPAYKVLRDEHPCFWSEEAQMWILSRYADIVSAGQDWRTYSSAQGNLMTELPGRAGATLGTTDPPRHDRLRGLIQHAFMKRNLEALAEPIRAIAQATAAPLAGLPRFDFIDDFSSKFTVRVLFAALGLPTDGDGGGEARVREKAVLMVQSDPVTRAKAPQHVAAYQWMQDYAATVIAERRKNPVNDLISHFSTAEIDGDRLDEREVLLTTTTLIMAGIESLGGFMSMFALNLADQAQARAEVVADPSLLKEAIEESLRYNTSAQRFKRCLQKDVTLHGQTMKAGDFVCLAYGSGNRDERQFPDPDRYDIRRKPRGHLGFGGGVHACLGTAIARLSVNIAFDEFHKVVPDYRREEETLAWMPSSTFRSPTRLALERPGMTALTFIEDNGATTELDVPDGWSLMQAATANGVDGILGECGGSCACATCHCYVDDLLMRVLPPPQPGELDMLANVAAERRPNSRLACQIKAAPGMAGGTVTLPPNQE